MKAKTNTNYISQLIAEGEHTRQDFKFAISDARKIAKSISAFANTEGGRLLIGVKDNGKIVGIRSEEEIYMIEAAASLYCCPQVEIKNYIHKIEGKDVLEVCIAENHKKPIYALDEQSKPWAYIRIMDENILATPVHLQMWKHNCQETKVILTYTERERHLLNILDQQRKITLNQCSKLARIPRQQTCKLLADFIRFGLVEFVFEEHVFYFRSKNLRDIY